MTTQKIVKTAKFDIPANSDIRNIQDFLRKKNITASRLINVDTTPRSDGMQSIIIFYIDGELENLPIPRGPSGPKGEDGPQGPKGEDGDDYIPEAVCVYYYEK